MVDLGTLGGSRSVAYGVNESGQVMGWSETAGIAGPHAFLWTLAGGMVDLGTLGGTDSEVFALSENGQASAGATPLAMWKITRSPGQRLAE